MKLEIDALIKELEVKVDLSVKEDNIKLTEEIVKH